MNTPREEGMPELPGPELWIIPGDDGGRISGFVDAMAWSEDEFTKPMVSMNTLIAYGQQCWQAATQRERERCAQIAENSHPNEWAFIASAIRSIGKSQSNGRS